MKKKIRVSLITTVLNESSSINEFIKSVLSQTVLPQEFIIVDGGSTDGTYEILKKYSKRYKWIKVFQIKGASIGEGRNFAIKKAKNEIIACTDAGCILDKKWLEEISKPFFKNKNIDVVVGIYKPYYTNNFEYFQGKIVVPEVEKIFLDPSRMSSRSIAFKKKVWKIVGGYPNFSAGEDTYFNLMLINFGFKFYFAKKAIVYWKMRKTWKEFAKQFYKYGVGDRRSGNIWKLKKNLFFVIIFWCYLSLIFLSFFIFPIFFSYLFFLPFLYFLIEGIKLFMKTRKVSAIFYGFLLIFIKRIAYVIGVSLGK